MEYLVQYIGAALYRHYMCGCANCCSKYFCFKSFQKTLLTIFSLSWLFTG